MPAVSVIIPAYNAQAYIEECLASVQRQECPDLEIICVDDQSTDNTADIISRIAQADSRITLIRNPRNLGQFASRHIGTAASSGDRILFLDADDSFEPQTCKVLLDQLEEDPADILHFGTNIIPEEGCSIDVVEGLAAFMNPSVRKLVGEDILKTCFIDEAYDYNICHKLLDGNLVRSVFASLPTDRRLIGAEDAVEYFAIALHAGTYRFLVDSRFYNYHVGRGQNGRADVSAAQFVHVCENESMSMQTLREYLQRDDSVFSLQTAYVRKAYDMLRGHIAAHAMNIWQDSVALGDRCDALAAVRGSWSDEEILTQLERFIRDDAYFLLNVDSADSSRDYHEQRLRESLACRDDLFGTFDYYASDDPVLKKYHSAAQGHLSELRDLERKDAFKASPIKLLVSAHKLVTVPAGACICPVQVGSQAASTRFKHMLHDDTGDNISERNKRYCEMTAQYWAWKNLDADYYGFCHYRRYFNFSGNVYDENPWGEIDETFIDDEAIEKYGLSDERIEATIDGYDLVLTEIKDVSTFPEHFTSMRNHYERAPLLNVADVDLLLELIDTMEPDYSEDAHSYFDGTRSCFCNMYIMRKDIFNEYCSWLFPLLDAFEQHRDMTYYSQEAMRTTGHLAERLFNIFLTHANRVGRNWKTKELQCVRFSDADKPAELDYAFDSDAVPVVFAADDNYVPMLSVAIYSVVKNASPNRNYDIVVLERNIDQKNKQKMIDFLASYDNVSLRFYNVRRIVKGYKLEANAHISTETYYRFLIQAILPFYSKVLYLDSDLVVDADVADLYDMDIDGCYLAAVRDVDYLGNLNMSDGTRMAYSKDVLHMTDPYMYFQAGVLLLNTAVLRKVHTVDEWLTLASVPYLYNDQDVLNTNCEGHVRYLDLSWNVMVDCGRLQGAIIYAPVEWLEGYLASRRDPKIIHYAGYLKPWNDPKSDFADSFWAYARETPFYEGLLTRLMKMTAEECSYRQSEDLIRRQASRRWYRKVADVIVPIGSKRRERLKHLRSK